MTDLLLRLTNSSRPVIFRPRWTWLLGVIAVVSLVSSGCVGMIRRSQPAGYNQQNEAVAIHFLDVGYGAATFIQSPTGKNILIDGGYFRYGDQVSNFISAQGATQLDLVINTHPHPDHVEGLVRVLERFPTAECWGSHPLEAPEVPGEFGTTLTTRGIPYQVVTRGRQWSDGDLILDVLHPQTLVSDLNDCSLVIKLRYKSFICLLAGDVGPDGQRAVMTAYPDQLQAAVLQIPHHGGEGVPEFVVATLPAAAILTVGPNVYGNPRLETLTQYAVSGASILRTDKLGTISVFSTGVNFTIKSLGARY